METTTHVDYPAGALARPLKLAALTALALAANVAEGYLTLPIPFVRLGIANVFILIALWEGGTGDAFLVAAAKTLGASLILGTLATPVFVLNGGGTVAAWLVMSVVAMITRRDPRAIILASVCGGLAHAGWQVLYLQWLAMNADAVYLAAFLLPWGGAAGVVVGVLTSKLRVWEKADV